MRKLTLQDIQSRVQVRNDVVNLAVANFHEKTREQGYEMSRNRPRLEDEIQALNYIARSILRKALMSSIPMIYIVFSATWSSVTLS
jgi:hypothetical protein